MATPWEEAAGANEGVRAPTAPRAAPWSLQDAGGKGIQHGAEGKHGKEGRRGAGCVPLRGLVYESAQYNNSCRKIRPEGWRHAWSQGFCIYRRVQSLENKCSGSFQGQTQPQAPGWATHGGWMLLCRCPTASGSVIRREPEHSCL